MNEEARMSDNKAPGEPVSNKTIDEQVALLMDEIQKEAVPERLLELARQLQKALSARAK